jgi:hypothetical protein
MYETIMLPVVIYICETSSLTLREEHRLRVFEKWVLRRIFGLRRDEVTGGQKRLHDEELDDLVLLSKYNWNDQVKEDDVGRACTTSGREE